MTDPVVTIRRPVPEDWPRVLEILETANFHRIGGPEMEEYPLADCFVAAVGGAVVGVAGYKILDAVTAKTTLLAVAPEYRRRGIGTRLQSERVAFLRGRGIVTLYTNCDDPEVVRWNIRHFGFSDTGERLAKLEPFGRSDKDEWVHLRADIGTVPESPRAPGEVEELMRGVRAGDAAAARDVFTRYARRLVAHADKRLAVDLRARIGGDDVVQSVFRTFFRRSAVGEFRIDSSGQLWGLLLRITVTKAHEAARRATADKRNPSREARGTVDADPLADALTREPNPGEAAAFNDLVAQVLAAHTPLHGRILELRLAGHGPSEIAQQLGVTRQTVHRHLTRLGEWLRAAVGGDPDHEAPP